MTYQVITATLKARTAIHIGSGRGNDLTDALIRRDAQGRPFIPGTAIAGALRTLLTRLAPRLELENNKLCAALTGSGTSCDCPVCRLFGDINPSDREDADSRTSRVLVFNAYLRSNSCRPLIRDGVGIDRVTGAAARAGSVKFDLEVLPAGAEFELRIELRDTDEQDKDEQGKQLLAAGLAEWQAGRLWLGGRVARGLGAFDLDNLEFKELPLDTPERVLDYLKADEPWKIATPQTQWLEDKVGAVQSRIQPINGNLPKAVVRYWVIIEGTLQAEGPLLTNDALVSGRSGFDHAPLLAQVGDWRHPVLTGAGLRGVLRSHAERIARTLTTLQVWDSTQDSGQRERFFLIGCSACSPVESRLDAPLASCDALLKEAKVPSDALISDEQLCLACRLFGSTRRGSRLIVEDAPYAGERPPMLKMFDFLAIDRFTGGGKDGAKFDALALWKPAFTLRLYLENPQEWELGWLALVLRDLEEGWLSVGFGAAKGFGRVRLQDWTATFGYLMPEDLPAGLDAPDIPDESGLFKTTILQGGTKDWQTIAQRWAGKFQEEVHGFERTKLPPLKTDSYFGKVNRLYPVLKGVAS